MIQFYRGKLSIEAGVLFHKVGPLWVPDGLHIWWHDRGVHLYWNRGQGRDRRRVIFDRAERP